MTAVAAFKTALLAELPSLRAFAISLSGSHDHADDLVQETVMKAWGAHASFIPGTSLRAWLFTIMRNTYFSQYRKARREVQDSDGEAAARLVSAPAQDGHLDLADFRSALEKLPDDQREALIPPRWRLGLFLRRGGGDLRMRRRNHQEPRQQGAPETHATHGDSERG